ncbi:rod shape-determining protein MreC [Candidatus Palauibacter sp.]|uniref:rod shape-determining protein MreC n=1 Tax=Candidatus Palauibacter sp. TaxID=3101350 RepID=UPI003B016E04
MSYPGARPPRRRPLEVVALVVVLGLSGIAASLPREQEGQIESAVRGTVLYPFLRLHRVVSERGQIEQRNRVLVAERDSLTELLMRYRARSASVGEAPPDSGRAARRIGSTLPAIVYPGRPQIGNPDIFFLSGPDPSELDLPVGVFTGLGLVGVARAPQGRGVSGDFWSHADFRVSVMTEDGAVSGFVRPMRLEGGQPLLLLEGVPFQAEIPSGTLLLTTGIGAVYPPGVPVGHVREPSEPEAGWMKRYVVEPAVWPQEVGDVFVWERPDLPAEEEPEVVRDQPETEGAAGTVDTVPARR